MNQVYEQYSQDPDETFKMYVDRLMKVPPSFSGTFASAPQQSSEAPSANKGLLTSLFPEYADKMGGEAGGTDYSNPFGNASSGGFSPSSGRGTFASADEVASAASRAGSLANSGRGLANLGSAVLGPYGMLLGLLPGLAQSSANSSWDSFNAGQDSDAAARAEAASLGGLGTFSNQQGNIGTFSSPETIAAYDREMFGDLPTTNNVTVGGPISSPNLQGTSLDTGGGGGGDYGSFSDGAAADAAGGYGGYW
jgi:hypothetical protein